ncbi:MAG: hypothetical protein GEU80_04325 [Dehalococcoidia bacterium]|nr:hypothetical protein [Dehalococcoidia bacterium]
MTTKEIPDLQLVTDQVRSCVHHWVLGDPAGGAILGECKRCGATRVYSANPEGTERFDDYRELTAGGSYYAARQSA